MSAITTSEALFRFIQNKTFEVEVGAVRPATLTKAEEFVAMLGENLPDNEVEALDPQDFRRLIQTAAKRWGPLRLKQLRAFVLGWLPWCIEDEGLIERTARTGSLKTPKVVAKPKETYTPEEIRTLFNDLDSYGRSLLGLGLFAGSLVPRERLERLLGEVQRRSIRILGGICGRPVMEPKRFSYGTGRLTADQLNAMSDATHRVMNPTTPWSEASWSGPIPCRVNSSVEHRGRGFASSAVAFLSRHPPANGVIACTLFTDLANPTSNRIYERIGDRRIATFDSLRWR